MQNLPSLDPEKIQATIDTMWRAMGPKAHEKLSLKVTDAQGVELDFRTPATPSTELAEPASSTPS